MHEDAVEVVAVASASLRAQTDEESVAVESGVESGILLLRKHEVIPSLVPLDLETPATVDVLGLSGASLGRERRQGTSGGRH